MNNDNIKSPLPVLFLCITLIVFLLNLGQFTTIFVSKTANVPIGQLKESINSIESEYVENFSGKTNYIDINGLFSRIIYKKELNDLHKLDNGHLTNNVDDTRDMLSIVNYATDFKKYLDLYDIPYAYVQPISVLASDDDNMIPAGYTTLLNQNTDKMIQGFIDNGINFLDLRQNSKEDGMSNYDLFYKTDHHWNTYGAFWATQHVVHFINEQLNIETNVLNEYFFDMNNYETEIFENEFLGSYGKRTGVFYAGVDDIAIITPVFETNFTVETPAENITLTGDFTSTQLDYTIFDNNTSSPFSKNEYTVYPLHFDYSKITNHNATNDAVILILRDSFTSTLAPYLAMHYKEIHLYDLRYGNKQEGFIEILHQIEPDIVLQIQCRSNPLTDSAMLEILD